MTAQRLLSRTVEDGGLVLVARGTPSATSRVASRYRLGVGPSVTAPVDGQQ